MSLYNYQGIPDFLVDDAPSAGTAVYDEERIEANELSDDVSSTSSVGEVFEEDIGMLRDYSFISVSPDGSSFEMHRLVQLATQVWLKKKGEEHYQRLQSASVARLAVSFLKPNYEHWKECRALYPHAKLVIEARNVRQDALLSLAFLLFYVARFARSQGAYMEAEAAVPQQEHYYLWDLAMVLEDQGKYIEAEGMCRRVQQGYERLLGREHPDTLTSVDNVASVLRDQGKYNEAEGLSRRALQGREQVLGSEHPDTLVNVANLAVLLRDQGRYNEAEELERRALQGFVKVLGPEHPDTVLSIWSIAALQQEQGLFEQALETYRKASSGLVRVLGLSHPHTQMCMEQLEALQSRIERLSASSLQTHSQG